MIEKISIEKLRDTVNGLVSFGCSVIIINENTKKVVDIDGIRPVETVKNCYEQCPLRNDKNGCLCKNVINESDICNRFVTSNDDAYFIMAKPIILKFNTLIIVAIQKLNTRFSMGVITDTKQVEHIVNISNNIYVDPLTKVKNRRYYNDNIQYLVDNAKSNMTQLCLAQIDIDNFKKFNDTYGHSIGDEVLKIVAYTAESIIGNIKGSQCVRMGGDEFIVICPSITLQAFRLLMNKLCVTIANKRLKYKNNKVTIGISIGTAELLTDKLETCEQLYNKADSRLYISKEKGKGTVS